VTNPLRKGSVTKHEKTDIQDEARKLGMRSPWNENAPTAMTWPEVFLEIGLVITSITYSRENDLLAFGDRAELVGYVVAVTGALIH